MNVKVCNLRSNDFIKEFVESITKTGFAVVTHHGVDKGLIKDTQSAWKEFFTQSRSYKDLFIDEKNPNMGFVGFGGERAVGAQKVDLKEFYHWKPGYSIPIEVAALTYKLFSLLEGDVSSQLLYALNTVAPVGKNYSEMCQDSDNTILRALYYPALKDIEIDPGSVRASAHEDINFLTLLVAASAPGLQVLDKRGNWHDVPFEDNSITINVGDMLQLASGRKFQSTTHRVNNPEDTSSDRISIPLFVHARSSTILAPGFTAQEYLKQRLNEIYMKAKK